ncbi:MAG: WYL domain-containing protein [Opitutaceae bacterium]|jgi:predicted DNA-binding transcriptional regulator YafY
MPAKKPSRRVSRSQQERLTHIEQLLWWRGWVRRNDLTRAFGISSIQASIDLREYRERHPNAMRYDQNAARYVATTQLRLGAGAGSLEEAAAVFAHTPRPAAAGPWIARVTLPARRAEPEVAQAVVRAILAEHALRIRYASIHSNTFRWRWITPHALGHDGYRWHVRAYCADEREFRDFVLGRIAETAEIGPAAAKREDDSAWSSETTVHIKPNPALGEAQRRALELDFVMKAGRLKLTATPGLLHYALGALGLADDGRPQPVRFVKDR